LNLDVRSVLISFLEDADLPEAALMPLDMLLRTAFDRACMKARIPGWIPNWLR
jgi:hypothetical protein